MRRKWYCATCKVSTVVFRPQAVVDLRATGGPSMDVADKLATQCIAPPRLAELLCGQCARVCGQDLSKARKKHVSAKLVRAPAVRRRERGG